LTYRKSHTGFLLVLKSATFRMTLNGIMTIILCYFTNSVDLAANYITVAEVRPILIATEM